MAFKAAALGLEVPGKAAGTLASRCQAGASCQALTAGQILSPKGHRLMVMQSRAVGLASSRSSFLSPTCRNQPGQGQADVRLSGRSADRRVVRAVLDAPPSIGTSGRNLEKELAEYTQSRTAEMARIAGQNNSEGAGLSDSEEEASDGEGVVDDEIRPPRGETAGAVSLSAINR
jgi:hypothetical protein